MYNNSSIRSQAGVQSRAVQCAFIAIGLSVGSWSAMVPFAKAWLGVDDGTLGILLLALGLGGIVSMLATGLLLKHLRARTLALGSVALTASLLVSLSVVSHPSTL